jgi:predicted SAM-dependent methyltransferase
MLLHFYLEHDYNLQETIEKLFCCLNPRGRLIIEVPDYNTILAKRQKQFWHGIVPDILLFSRRVSSTFHTR